MEIPVMIADDSIFLVNFLRSHGYSPARALAALAGAIVALGFLQERREIADMPLSKIAALAMAALEKGSHEG